MMSFLQTEDCGADDKYQIPKIRRMIRGRCRRQRKKQTIPGTDLVLWTG